MWAMAKYDFGLSWEEFCDCTPRIFWALFNRYHVSVRHLRYANALTASAVYNTSRTKKDDPVIEAFEFVATSEETEKRTNRKRYIEYVNKSLSMWATSPEKFAEKRPLVIADLEFSGCDYAEQLVDRMFPQFKDKHE
jgi:hypothetical protein